MSYFDPDRLLNPDLSFPPELEEEWDDRTRRNEEAEQRDKIQTQSLERIIEMLNESSQKQDERYVVDNKRVLFTLVVSTIAAVASVIGLLVAIIVAVLK